MNKHTPAPWRTSDVEGGIYSDLVEAREKANNLDADGYLAQCWADEYNGEIIPREEMHANAKLMAAAPEMLEALQNLENDGGTIPKPIWDMVQSAIKKATGEDLTS